MAKRIQTVEYRCTVITYWYPILQKDCWKKFFVSIVPIKSLSRVCVIVLGTYSTFFKFIQPSAYSLCAKSSSYKEISDTIK